MSVSLLNVARPSKVDDVYVLYPKIREVDVEEVKATITWPIIKGGENISSIKKS